MLSSLSPRSFMLTLAALGFTGTTPPGGGAGIPPRSTIDRPDPAALTRAPDGLFYVTAAVNGVPIRFVVDTGANVVVLTGVDAAAARVTGAGDDTPSLRTAGGSAAMRWASIDRLTIGDHAITKAQAVIVGADGPPHSLLGQSALSRLESVTIRGDRLQLR